MFYLRIAQRAPVDVDVDNLTELPQDCSRISNPWNMNGVSSQGRSSFETYIPSVTLAASMAICLGLNG
jgi:hypothetical protein